MVVFICMGLLDMWGARTENDDKNPVVPAYEANSTSVALEEQISFGHLNVDRVLSDFAFYNYVYDSVDVAKWFVMYFCHILSFCCLSN